MNQLWDVSVLPLLYLDGVIMLRIFLRGGNWGLARGPTSLLRAPGVNKAFGSEFLFNDFTL